MSSNFRLQAKDINWVGLLNLISHRGAQESMTILHTIFPVKMVDQKFERLWRTGLISHGELTKRGEELFWYYRRLSISYMHLKFWNDNNKGITVSKLQKSFFANWVQSMDLHPKYFDLADGCVKLSKKGKRALKHLSFMLNKDSNLQCKDLDYEFLVRNFKITTQEVEFLFPSKVVSLKLGKLRN
jgi:hypothetical protein